MKKILLIVLMLMLSMSIYSQYKRYTPTGYDHNGFEFFRFYDGPISYWFDNWNNYYVYINKNVYIMSEVVWLGYSELNWVRMINIPIWSIKPYCREKRFKKRYIFKKSGIYKHNRKNRKKYRIYKHNRKIYKKRYKFRSRSFDSRFKKFKKKS